MAKFYGIIGFVKPEESPANSGIWVETKTEKYYYGDIIKNNRRWSAGESINDNIVISNSFSIISDTFADDNLGYMKYLVYGGVKWSINSVEIALPRIVLTTGGIYNG